MICYVTVFGANQHTKQAATVSLLRDIIVYMYHLTEYEKDHCEGMLT